MCDHHDDALRLSRRGFLFAAAMASAVHPLRPAWGQSSGAAVSSNAISPDDALRRLLDGNARYASNLSTNKDFSAGRAARALAQYPFASILSCSDSRVAPELVFDQGPGELFIVRIAGNFVDDDGLASLEYSAQFLGTPLVMVLGHTNCGAVSATIKVIADRIELPGHLTNLIGLIRPAIEAGKARNPADLLAEATAENVRHNVRRLERAEPLLSGLVASGKVKMVGGIYDIVTGKVTLI